MDDISFQHVFTRVYSYLCEAGVEMSSERCRQMLQLIDEVMAEIDESASYTATDRRRLTGHRLLKSAMDRLPEYFAVPEVVIPTAAPPLYRGSIGYHSRG
ncbi:MAG: hypothetical protein ACTHYN_10170 [Marinobacter sp.]|uniref:hypothetical protein n=1 Tax=Marinobacter sp. TaxID=50741 RepID=UPI003F977BB4